MSLKSIWRECPQFGESVMPKLEASTDEISSDDVLSSRCRVKLVDIIGTSFVQTAAQNLRALLTDSDDVDMEPPTPPQNTPHMPTKKKLLELGWQSRDLGSEDCTSDVEYITSVKEHYDALASYHKDLDYNILLDEDVHVMLTLDTSILSAMECCAVDGFRVAQALYSAIASHCIGATVLYQEVIEIILQFGIVSEPLLSNLEREEQEDNDADDEADTDSEDAPILDLSQ